MKIVYKNYEIEPSENSSDRFDLIKVTTKRRIGTGSHKDPNGEEYEAKNDMGYAMSLSYCFQKIIFDIIAKATEETITIKEYIKEFEKQREELKTILNQKLNFKLN